MASCPWKSPPRIHREKRRENKRLVVSGPFKLPKSTQKSGRLSSKIKEHLPATPNNSRTNALINALNFQRPNTRTNVVNSVNISRVLDLTVYTMISNENAINLAIVHES